MKMAVDQTLTEASQKLLPWDSDMVFVAIIKSPKFLKMPGKRKGRKGPQSSLYRQKQIGLNLSFFWRQEHRKAWQKGRGSLAVTRCPPAMHLQRQGNIMSVLYRQLHLNAVQSLPRSRSLKRLLGCVLSVRGSRKCHCAEPCHELYIKIQA